MADEVHLGNAAPVQAQTPHVSGQEGVYGTDSHGASSPQHDAVVHADALVHGAKLPHHGAQPSTSEQGEAAGSPSQREADTAISQSAPEATNAQFYAVKTQAIAPSIAPGASASLPDSAQSAAKEKTSRFAGAGFLARSFATAIFALFLLVLAFGVFAILGPKSLRIHLASGLAVLFADTPQGTVAAVVPDATANFVTREELRAALADAASVTSARLESLRTQLDVVRASALEGPKAEASGSAAQKPVEATSAAVSQEAVLQLVQRQKQILAIALSLDLGTRFYAHAPFEAALAAVDALGVADAGLAPLKAFAATGYPAPIIMESAFAALARDGAMHLRSQILEREQQAAAQKTSESAFDLSGWLWQKLGTLVRVEPSEGTASLPEDVAAKAQMEELAVAARQQRWQEARAGLDALPDYIHNLPSFAKVHDQLAALEAARRAMDALLAQAYDGAKTIGQAPAVPNAQQSAQPSAQKP